LACALCIQHSPCIRQRTVQDDQVTGLWRQLLAGGAGRRCRCHDVAVTRKRRRQTVSQRGMGTDDQHARRRRQQLAAQACLQPRRQLRLVERQRHPVGTVQINDHYRQRVSNRNSRNDQHRCAVKSGVGRRSEQASEAPRVLVGQTHFDDKQVGRSGGIERRQRRIGLVEGLHLQAGSAQRLGQPLPRCGLGTHQHRCRCADNRIVVRHRLPPLAGGPAATAAGPRPMP
jgi:hypothetical protein